MRARSYAALARGRPAAGGVRILFYHRVSPDRDPLAVTPARFAAQMDTLAAGGHRVVDLVDAAAMLERGDVPDRTVVLNFDDGYLDVAENAVPVLEHHGFTATVFIVPGLIDGEVTLDWYERQPPLMSWEDVARLDAGSPLRFGAHTVTHPNLLTVSDRQARDEIAGSKRIVEERLGRPVEAFCYPAGLFGDREAALVGEAGYRVAVSCEPGTNIPATDPHRLRRTQVDQRDALVDFRAKVGGGHDRPLLLRTLHRRLRYGARSHEASSSR
ncbi:MAG TPA: polysaccharide deacetylase family protein [Solirubrobacteraceae bacterium]|nr:polysaccharide deacetylase family protein [Solirubrobacteraceae bacterium]